MQKTRHLKSILTFLAPVKKFTILDHQKPGNNVISLLSIVKLYCFADISQFISTLAD